MNKEQEVKLHEFMTKFCEDNNIKNINIDSVYTVNDKCSTLIIKYENN